MGSSLGLDFQNRNTSNPLSRGKERSRRIRSGASLVPSTTSCRNKMADAMLFKAVTSWAPSFFTTAVDCRVSAGVSSIIKTLSVISLAFIGRAAPDKYQFYQCRGNCLNSRKTSLWMEGYLNKLAEHFQQMS